MARLRLRVTALLAPSTSLGAHLGPRASYPMGATPRVLPQGQQEDGSMPSQEAEVPSESLAQTSPCGRGTAALHGAGEGLFSRATGSGWCWSPMVSAVGAGPAAVPGAEAQRGGAQSELHGHPAPLPTSGCTQHLPTTAASHPWWGWPWADTPAAGRRCQTFPRGPGQAPRGWGRSGP